MSRTDVRLRQKTARRRRRLGRTLVVASIAACGLGFLAGHATAVTSHSAARHHQRVYVVRPGDSLWSIALRIGAKGSDPRPLVYRITSMNHVQDAGIVPGQRLVLPASSA